MSSSSKLPHWFWRIKESSSNGNWQEVFTLYRDTRKTGVQFIHPSLFPPIFKACLFLCFKHGESALNSSVAVFDCMRSRDSVSWNIMINGHLGQGAVKEGFEPNNATLVLVIQACRSLKAIYEGMKIHGYIVTSGFWVITSVQNSLLNMYADIEMEAAQKLFDEMFSRDLISWSVMIGAYVQSEEAEVAFRLFREMVTKNEIEMDGQIMCHDIKSALKSFREMPRRNVVSWNSLLSGFVSNDKYLEALLLFDSMWKAGIDADGVTLVNLLQTCKHLLDPIHLKSIHLIIIRRGYEVNDLVMNSLIDAYAKCNLITLAWSLFNQMKRRDTVTWSTMIAGFTHCGMPDEAIAVFQEMNQVQNKHNVITVLNLLEACSISADLKRSQSAHGIAIRRGVEADVAVGTAILDMYSKCGAIEASERVFDQIPKKNVVSWSAMIAAYGMNGLPHYALALVDKMRAHGLRPNPVTTLSVLSACSHGGLIEEGLLFFQELVQDHAVELRLEHYSCVVDLLARAGKLDTAMELIEKMPNNGLKPGASAWGALLSACRTCGNSELGSGAFSRILELEPSNSAGYLLASSMYAAGGLWVDAARMRWLVRGRGVRMVTGYSLVHVNDKACKFVAGDKHHSFSGEVYLVSEQLHLCMKIDKMHEEAVFE
ncbi:hypothetical protein CsSME_00030366 [Camellia sinensis var. sinensis]